MLSARGVRKQIGRDTVLDGINLRLFDDEVVFLLGPSGSGKTVLCHILSGRLQADSGGVLVEGRPLRGGSLEEAYGSGVHYINRDTRLIESMSIGENLCMRNPLRLGAFGYVRKVEAIAADLCREFGLVCDVRKTPRQVALTPYETILLESVRAIYQKAKIILYDSFLFLLTPEEREDFLGLVSTLKNRGIAVLVCDQSARYALRYGDRLVFMREGSAIADLRREDCPEPLAAKLLYDEASLEWGRAAPEEKRGAAPMEPVYYPAQSVQSAYVMLHPREALGLHIESINEYRWFSERMSDEAEMNRLNRQNAGLQAKTIGVLTTARVQNDFVPDLTLAENLYLPRLPKIAHPGGVTLPSERRFLKEELCGMLSVPPERWDSPMRSCSRLERGEVILYRTLFWPCDVIVLIGLIQETDPRWWGVVAAYVKAARRFGKSILLLDRSLSTLESICDRVVKIRP